MTEVIVGLFAPVLVIFIVLMVGERVTETFEAVISFVWSILE